MAKQSLQKTEHLCWHVLTLFWHFFNRLYHFFDMFWHIFDSFDIFLTDRQTDGQKDRPAYLIWHVLTLFDMFWHFFDSFWHFLTFFWPTNLQNLVLEAPARSLKTMIPFIERLNISSHPVTCSMYELLHHWALPNNWATVTWKAQHWNWPKDSQ